jgi:hypothetical protein
MNGGFLYVGLEVDTFEVYIEKFQINGGICYFDMTYISELRIQNLEMNGGSFHLVVHSLGGLGPGLQIDSLELNTGHLSLAASQVKLHDVLLSGGSFNCSSNRRLLASQVTLGSTLSSSSRRQSIADPLSISGLPEVYIKHSDGQIEQHGTAQPGDQNIQMSTVLSPLYVAARNGHLEAVQLLLESRFNFDKAWPTMNPLDPLDIAQRHGHHEIVRVLQEKGQEVEENNEREIGEKEKETRSTRKRGGQKRRERNEGDCRIL